MESGNSEISEESLLFPKQCGEKPAGVRNFSRQQYRMYHALSLRPGRYFLLNRYRCFLISLK